MVIDVLTVGGAAHTLRPLPAWTVALVVAAGLWWLGIFVGDVCARALRTPRRLSWIGHGGVAVLCGAAMLPRGRELRVWAVALVALGSGGRACAHTGYLKMGGRPCTVSAADRRRDEQEGGERRSDDAAPQPITR